jgi:polyisoprenoid-binding protein YceI
MKRLSILASAALLAAAGAVPLQAETVAFNVRPYDTAVGFTVMKFGVFKEHGRFKHVDGTLHVDEKEPERSRMRLSVDVASVDTGATARDETLRSDDFFDAKRFPQMTFVSRSVKKREPGVYDVTGDLTIRGVTKRITVPVRLLGRAQNGDEEIVGFESEFRIDRTEFGVDGARWSGGRHLISKEVDVKLAISMFRK